MPGSLAEQIYYKMPVLIQNGIFSIYGWTLSRRRYNRFFYDHLARLMEMEWWSSEQIEEIPESEDYRNCQARLWNGSLLP